MVESIVKIFLAVAISFFVGMSLTPTLTYYLYKNKMWKKKAGKISTDGRETPVFNELHKEKEVGTPRLGGLIISSSVAIVAILLWILAHIIPTDLISKLDFLSRNQTWIPLATMILGAFIGAIDDILEIKGNGDYKAGGLSLKKRIGLVAIIGLLCGFWFYSKLEISSIMLLGGLELFVGPLIILIFALVMLIIYSGGVIDGIDGLAGGVFAIAFSAYAGIAFGQGQYNLAAFCGATSGGILAFLWFNIPPARFYMSETGTMALTMTLTVVAFMTDKLGNGRGLIALPIIAFPLILTTLSDVIQLISKKTRNGKKVFKIAPLHHHFEALGWPSYKVTMRYWVLSIVFAILGVSIALI